MHNLVDINDEGYILIDRDIRSSFLWEPNRKRTKFEAWICLILDASYKPGRLVIDGEIIDILRGQLLTSQHKLAKEWKWNKGVVRRYLNILENLDVITYESNSKYTIITINNYDKINKIRNNKNNIAYNGPRTDHERTTNGPRTDHERTTNGPLNELNYNELQGSVNHERTTNGPVVDHERTSSEPGEPRTDHERTTNGPLNELNYNELQGSVNHERTTNGPRTDHERTTNGPRTDLLVNKNNTITTTKTNAREENFENVDNGTGLEKEQNSPPAPSQIQKITSMSILSPSDCILHFIHSDIASRYREQIMISNQWDKFRDVGLLERWANAFHRYLVSKLADDEPLTLATWCVSFGKWLSKFYNKKEINPDDLDITKPIQNISQNDTKHNTGKAKSGKYAGIDIEKGKEFFPRFTKDPEGGWDYLGRDQGNESNL